MLNFCDFIQVIVFTTNHHLKIRYLDLSFRGMYRYALLLFLDKFLSSVQKHSVLD